MMDSIASEAADSRSSRRSPLLGTVAIVCWLVAGATAAAAAPPVVAILAPPDGSVVTEGDPTVFSGTAIDAEDGDISSSISWLSDLDGPLGVGASILVGLTPGSHTIAARVVDGSGLMGSDSIDLIVNGRPVVVVTTPSDGSEFPDSEPIVFTANAFDGEEGDLSSSLSWSSDLDGDLGSGSSLSANLSAGTHVVTAAVVDSDGALGSASITIDVVSGAPQPVPAQGPVGLGLLACLLLAAGMAGTKRVVS